MTGKRLSVRRRARPRRVRPVRKISAFGRHAAPPTGWVERFKGSSPEVQARRSARIDGLFRRHGVECFDVVSDTANRLYQAAYPILSPLQRELSNLLLLRGYDLAEATSRLGIRRDVIISELAVIFSVLRRVLRGMDLAEPVISDDEDWARKRKEETIMNNNSGKEKRMSKNFQTNRTSSRKITRAGETWNKLCALWEITGQGELTDEQVERINRMHPEYRRNKRQWMMTRANMYRVQEHEALPLSREMARIVRRLDKTRLNTREVADEIGVNVLGLKAMRANRELWDPEVAQAVARLAVEQAGYVPTGATHKILNGQPVLEADLHVAGDLRPAGERGVPLETQLSLHNEAVPKGDQVTGIQKASHFAEGGDFLVPGKRYLIEGLTVDSFSAAIFRGYDALSNGLVFRGQGEGTFVVCRHYYTRITLAEGTEEE